MISVRRSSVTGSSDTHLCRQLYNSPSHRTSLRTVDMGITDILDSHSSRTFHPLANGHYLAKGRSICIVRVSAVKLCRSTVDSCSGAFIDLDSGACLFAIDHSNSYVVILWPTKISRSRPDGGAILGCEPAATLCRVTYLMSFTITYLCCSSIFPLRSTMMRKGSPCGSVSIQDAVAYRYYFDLYTKYIDIGSREYPGRAI